MLYTANPCADAERHEDAMEAACERAIAQEDKERTEAAAEFIDACEWGGEEPLRGYAASHAVMDVMGEYPEHFEELFFWAARQQIPEVRAMVAKIADAWADMQVPTLKVYVITIGALTYSTEKRSRHEAYEEATRLHPDAMVIVVKERK